MSLFYMNPFEDYNTGYESPTQIYLIPNPRRQERHQHHGNRNHRKIQKTTQKPIPKDAFHVTVDVHHFHPDEITVKAIDKNTISVEGKHEEKEDEHGSVYRHFVRKYVVSDEYDLDNVKTRLSTDGVLSITAPKVEKAEEERCRVIPITQTGKPARLQAKQEDGDKKMDCEQ